MRVRALDANGDWTFGNGRNNYLERNDAIKQSVVTRVKSFTDDWFLDTTANIPYYELLGEYNTQNELKDNISVVVRNTEGVLKINSLELENIDRNAQLRLNIDTIYQTNLTIKVNVGNS